ncbi:MAG: hypothetical protein ACLR2G_08240 [Phascolarctobacterium faecium]
MPVVKFLQFSSMKKLPESFLMKSLRNSRKQGGFTRIYRVGPRRSAVEMAIIELIYTDETRNFVPGFIIVSGNSQRETVNSQVALAIQDKRCIIII